MYGINPRKLYRDCGMYKYNANAVWLAADWMLRWIRVELDRRLNANRLRRVQINWMLNDWMQIDVGRWSKWETAASIGCVYLELTGWCECATNPGTRVNRWLQTSFAALLGCFVSAIYSKCIKVQCHEVWVDDQRISVPRVVQHVVSINPMP